MKNKIIKWISGLTLGAVLAFGAPAGISEVADAKADSTVDIDISALSGKGTSGSGGKINYEQNGISVVTDLGYGNGTQLRVYTGGVITISSTVGDITKLDFTFDSTYTGGLDTSIVNTGVSWTATMSKQARFKTIKLTIAGEVSGGGTETGGDDSGDTPVVVGDINYSLVTSVSDISNGDVVILGNTDKTKVSGSLFNDYLTAANFSWTGETFSLPNGVGQPLTVGREGQNYTLSYGSAKLASKEEKKLNKEGKGTATWTISISNKIATVQTTETSYGKFFFNPSGTGRFALYTSSTMQAVQLYKATGDTAKVVLESADVDGNVGDTVTLKVKETKGIDTVSSYAWSVVDGSEYVSLTDSETDTQVVNLDAKGTAKVKVTVNGEVEAIATITVNDWVYDVLDGDQYFISNVDGKGVLGGDLSNVVEADFTADTDVFTFEKAYKGDNSYWIKKGTQYVTFSADAGLGGSGSAIKLGSNKVNAWTVSVNPNNNEQYKISTVCNDKKVRSLAQNTNDWKWYAFEDEHYVSLFEKGNLEFKEFEIAHKPSLAYLYLGDDFSKANIRTGLIVNAVYTNGFKQDITDDVAWGKLQADGTVSGTIEILGEEKTVTVDNIPVYCPVESSLVVEGIKDTYVVGEEIAPTSVKVKYSNGTFTTDLKAVAKENYTVTPSIATTETETVKVSLNLVPTIYKEFDIEVVANKWVPASVLGAGDEILFTWNGYEGVMTESSTYERLSTQTYDYAPTGAAVFTLESAGAPNKFYAKGETGKYLNAGVDNILSYGKTDTLNFYDDKFNEFPFQIPGDSKTYHSYYSITKNVDENGTISYDGISYLGTETSGYSAYVQLSLVVMDEDEAWLEITGNYTDGTEIDEIVVYNIHKDASVFSVYDPTDTSEGMKTALTFTYTEPLSEEENPYWDVYVDGVGYLCGGTTKFSTENEESGNDLMIYRNSEIEIKANVAKLTVKPTFEGDTLQVKQGEAFDPSRIIVTATYDNGTHTKVAYPSYTFEGLDTSVVGEQTVTVKYGGKTATFKLLVTGSVSKVTITNSDAQLQENIFADSEPFQIKTTVEGTLKNDEPLKYTSSDPTILSIDETGLATPHKGGTVIVTVTDYYRVVSDSKTVNVRTRLTGVELDEESIEIKTGATATLTATALPQGAVSTFKWESSDESVAKVNGGVVTGVNPGTATITVKAGSYQATCEVTVVAEVASSVSITAPKETIDIGETVQLTATILPTNTYDKDVTWTSITPNIASVNNSGVVTGLAKGNAFIKVTTSNGKESTILIKVEDIPDPVIDPVDNQNKGCGGSLIASTAIVSLLTLAGASLLVSKRKDN